MNEPTSVSLRCARCEYELKGLAPSGQCPECGFSIDDSLRAAGQWTGRRLRRLRTVAWCLAISSWSWVLVVGLPLAFMAIQASPVRVFACSLAVLIVAHVAALATASIGGVYAASRHPGHVRIAIGTALGLLLLTSGGCLGLAFLDVRPLQRAFENWGFAVMAVVRAVNICVATAWLCVGIEHVVPMAATRRAIAIGAASLIALDWLALGALFAAEWANLISLPWSSTVPASAATIIDAIAFSALGAIGLVTALSHELRTAIRDMRVG